MGSKLDNHKLWSPLHFKLFALLFHKFEFYVAQYLSSISYQKIWNDFWKLHIWKEWIIFQMKVKLKLDCLMDILFRFSCNNNMLFLIPLYSILSFNKCRNWMMPACVLFFIKTPFCIWKGGDKESSSSSSVQIWRPSSLLWT